MVEQLDKHVIVIMPKSPRPKKGRIGPDSWQNWYKACLKAKSVGYNKFEENSSWIILIPSSFSFIENGEKKEERNFYRYILTVKLCYPLARTRVCSGLETIDQINTGLKAACGLYPYNQIAVHIVWSCREHYWRWTLIKDWLEIPEEINVNSIKHEVNTSGIPRPKEFLTDLAAIPLILFYKIWYGKRAKEKFFEKIVAGVKKKRTDGKL